MHAILKLLLFYYHVSLDVIGCLISDSELTREIRVQFYCKWNHTMQKVNNHFDYL